MAGRQSNVERRSESERNDKNASNLSKVSACLLWYIRRTGRIGIQYEWRSWWLMPVSRCRAFAVFVACLFEELAPRIERYSCRYYSYISSSRLQWKPLDKLRTMENAIRDRKMAKICQKNQLHGSSISYHCWRLWADSYSDTIRV